MRCNSCIKQYRYVSSYYTLQLASLSYIVVVGQLWHYYNALSHGVHLQCTDYRLPSIQHNLYRDLGMSGEPADIVSSCTCMYTCYNQGRRNEFKSRGWFTDTKWFGLFYLIIQIYGKMECHQNPGEGREQVAGNFIIHFVKICFQNLHFDIRRITKNIHFVKFFVNIIHFLKKHPGPMEPQCSTMTAMSLYVIY